MDTLALVYYKLGRVPEAIQTQEKAIALYSKVAPATDPSLKGMRERLAQFKAGK